MLIMNDRTRKLTFYSPDNFSVLKTINVSDVNGAVNHLNELQYINGYIYANVYTTDKVAKIVPASGNVVGEFDFSALAFEAKNSFPGSLEMNGIAYDSLSGQILVKAKMWPYIYRISVSH